MLNNQFVQTTVPELLEPPVFTLASGLDALHMASPAGIAIVCTLVLLSTFSWSVMISKMLMLRRMRRQSDHFLEMFRGQQNPLEMYEMGNRFPLAPVAHVYGVAGKELAHYLKQSRQSTNTRFPSINATQLEAISAAMDRAAGEAAIRIEARTTILATAVSGAPFLGLLGTVWGVMDTFSAVARDSGAASLQSMAPGVASALVTTVVGLLVAIPAMFGYNFIVNRIRVMIVRLDNFVAEFQAVICRRFLAAPASASALAESPRALDDDEFPGLAPGLQPDFREQPVHARPPGPLPMAASHNLQEEPGIPL